MTNAFDSDISAAYSDLIGVRPELVEIGGHSYKAFVNRLGGSAEASQFGIDDTEDEIEISVKNEGKAIRPGERVKYDGTTYEIARVMPATTRTLTLTATRNGR